MLWRDIEALDNSIDVDTQTVMYLESRKLVERVSRWLLRHRKRPLAVAATIEFFAVPFAQLMTRLPALARGSEHERLQHATAAFMARGVPPELASRVAALDLLTDALDITELAQAREVEAERVAEVYAVVGDRLRLDWLHDRIVELPAPIGGTRSRGTLCARTSRPSTGRLRTP